MNFLVTQYLQFFNKFIYLQRKILLYFQDNITNGKSKVPDSNDTSMAVKDTVTQYLNVSGWLPGLSVV